MRSPARFVVAPALAVLAALLLGGAAVVVDAELVNVKVTRAIVRFILLLLAGAA